MKWILYLGLFVGYLSADDNSATIKSINFIQEGEVSKLIIDLDRKTFAERTHIKEDKQILLDLKNVAATDKVLRGIDTSEFTGSAVFVSPYRRPDEDKSIRFAIQLRDNVRSILENRKNRITLSIENRFGVFTKSKLEKAEEKSQEDLVVVEEKVNVPKSNSVEDILENLTQSGIKKYVGKIQTNYHFLIYFILHIVYPKNM